MSNTNSLQDGKVAKLLKPLPSFWREPFAKIVISKSEFYIQVGNDFNE